MALNSDGQLLDAKELLQKNLELREGMIFADLGIGSAAHFLYPAAEIIGHDGRAYGLDILKGVLSAANSRSKEMGLYNIKTVWTDLEVYGAAKEIHEESLDRIIMANLLFQTKQDDHVFNEANRMLKPGGKALIIDWNPGEGAFGPPQADRTSLDKVRQLAQVVKWKEVEVLTPSEYHFGVVFQK